MFQLNKYAQKSNTVAKWPFRTFTNQKLHEVMHDTK